MVGKLPGPIFPQSTLISRDTHWFVGAESWPAVRETQPSAPGWALRLSFLRRVPDK